MQRRFLQILGYLVIAGLVVVLAGVAGIGPLSSLKKDDAAEESSKGPRTTTTVPSSLERRSYARGDCVEWDQEARGALRHVTVIPCTEPHLLEIAGKVEAKQLDTYPTNDQWLQFFRATCTPIVAKLAGGHLDPEGRYYAGGLYPLADAWKAGDREVWCGAAATSDRALAADRLSRFRGSVIGASQQRLIPVGSCWPAGEAAFVVSCAQPHESEIVGNTPLGDAPPPARDDVAGWSTRTRGCRAVAEAYMKRPLAPNEVTGWFPVSAASWEAGARQVQCTVSKTDGQNPLPTTGSVKG